MSAARAVGRLRRLRRLRRRRVLEAASAWILGALVVLSLVLGSLLWASNPPLATSLPAAGGTGTYLAGDAVEEVGGAALLIPAQLQLLYASNPAADLALGDPGADPLFLQLWRAAAAVLAAVPPAALRQAQPVGPKQVWEAIGGHGAVPARTRALVAVLGPELTWSAWWQALGSRGVWSGPTGPRFDRVDIVVQPRTTTLFLLAAGAGVAVHLPAAVGRPLARLLASAEGQPQPGGYPLAPLPAVPALTFGVTPGIFVPQAPAWQPQLWRPEPLQASALAAALFPDPLSVRMFTQADGSLSYSNPQHWVLTVTPANGAVTFTAPPVLGLKTGTWWTGLNLAAAYTNRLGGWPPSAWLWAVRPLFAPGRCALAHCPPAGFAYVFQTRFAGIPVLGSVPALAISLEGGSVTSYARQVVVPTGPLQTVGARRWLPAPAVLAALERNPPPSLPNGPLEVDGLTPAWVPLSVGNVLEPAWAVRFAAPGSAPVIVLLDAFSGEVLQTLVAY